MPWSLSCYGPRGRLPRGQLLTTLLLLAGSAALTWLDPLTGLTCLPLLLGALALGRGRTWSVFLMLGGAAASFALAGQGLVHPATCVPAGAALLAVVLLTPALWRFDAPAFTLAAACMTGLGVGAALSALPAAEPAAQAPPTRPTVGGGCPGALKGPPDDPGPVLDRAVDLEIELGPAGQAVADDPLVLGSLDREIIRRVTDRHLPAVTDCFRRAAWDDHEHRRSVTLRYLIAAAGKVTHASILQSEGADQPLRRCLIDEVKRWRFPQCKCGGIVIVKQPFAARPLWE